MALLNSGSDGIGGGLPPQDVSNSGLFLTTTTTGNISQASWAAVGGGGSITVGAFGSTPTANAATASGTTLTLQPADGTHPGAITSGTQTIGGAKTLSGALSLGAGATSTAGNITVNEGSTLISTIGITATNDFPGVWLGIGAGLEAYGNSTLLGGGGLGATVLNGNGWAVSFRISNVEAGKFTTAGQLDLTGGAQQIKLSYTDISGTPGAGTASTATGRFAVVSGSAATFTITNTLVSATSVIMCQEETTGITDGSLLVVPGSGSFTVTPKATPSAASKYRFVVFN